MPYRSGNYAAATNMSRDAARRVRDADALSQASTLAFSAQCLALIGREMAEAEKLAGEAVELLGENPTDMPTLPLAFALIRDHQGDEAAAITMFERAIELAAKRGLWWLCATCWSGAARIELARDRPHAALRYCDELRVQANRIGDSADVPFGEVVAVLARRVLGEDLDVEPALAQLRAADSPVHLARALMLAAEHELARGQLACAARYADDAVGEATRTERDTLIVLARDVAARIAGADGREPDVKLHAGAVRSIPVESLSARARTIHAELAR